MEIEERKTVDMLTKDSVSILTQKFVEIDGMTSQVGENHRIAYSNSEKGRSLLTTEQPETVVNAVMSIWGDEPTVTEIATEDTGSDKSETNEAEE